MKRSLVKLRTRLLLLVLAAMIPAFGVIGYTAVRQHRQAAQAAQDKAMILAQLAANEQRRLIEATKQLLHELSKLPAVSNMAASAACHRALSDANRAYRHYTNIGVAVLDGNVVCNSRELARPVNIVDRGYFRRAVRSREFSIGDYQIGRVTGEAAVNFGYPVIGTDGALRGVVYAALNLSWLERLLADVKLPPDSTLTVVDNSGAILARTPQPENWVGRSLPDTPLIKSILARKQDGTAELAGLDGVARLYAFKPLLYGSAVNVYAAVGIPQEAAFAAARRGLTLDLALLLAAALLVLVIASVGSDVFVLRRVNALTDAAQRLGRGDLNARTGLTHGDEELEKLARSFDDMAAALQRVNRALKTLSAGNRATLHATDERSLMNELCRAIVDVGGYRFAWIGFAQDDAERAVYPVARAGLENEDGLDVLAQAIGRLTWADTERGRGPVGAAIRTGTPQVVRDIAADPNFAPWREQALRRGLASNATFPLLVEGKVIGALSIYSSEPDVFDKEELELLEEASRDLAFGIANLRARAEVDRAQAAIERMAYYDRLTGLPNHAQFEEHLRRSLWQSSERSIVLIVLGINRFREVNDALGFHHGDLLLKDIGTRIRAVVPEEITVARLRGDEFGILIPEADAGHGAETAKRILNSLRLPFSVGGLQLDVTAAAGIALFPEHGADTTQLMRCADVASQQAKKTGEDYVFYASEQDVHSARRLALAGELRHAIEAGELVLHYQPKIDIPGARVVGVEALVRWQHPSRGMIRPDEFISLAEHTGLIKPLTDWVMAEALRQSAAWHETGLTLPIAVNLSTRNLRDAELLNKLTRLLTAHHAQAEWLEVEITEGAVMDDPDGALNVLTRLSDMGVKLFIDDFGTGYSSLGYLKKLPVDAIKIDKSFVMDMLTSENSSAIVRSTIDLAHALDMKVVAEGVETEAMLDRLAALGCDIAQGYYFGRPLPVEQFKAWHAQYTSASVRG